MRHEVIDEWVRQYDITKQPERVWQLDHNSFDAMYQECEAAVLGVVRKNTVICVSENEVLDGGEAVVRPEHMANFCLELEEFKHRIGEDVDMRVWEDDGRLYCSASTELECPIAMQKRALDFLAKAAPLVVRRNLLRDVVNNRVKRDGLMPLTVEERLEAADQYFGVRKVLEETFPGKDMYMDKVYDHNVNEVVAKLRDNAPVRNANMFRAGAVYAVPRLGFEGINLDEVFRRY